MSRSVRTRSIFALLISDEERAQIAHRNAERIFRIPA